MSVTVCAHNTTDTYTAVVVVLLHPSSLPLTLILLILTLPPLHPPHTHLFCTLSVVIFLRLNDLLWMHVYYVHILWS